MDKPDVSIIIASYNRAHFIGEMLDSVINQTYSNWECLIIDDGSSDNTEEIVQSYTEKDKRFRYLNRPASHQKGLPGARNYGLEKAYGYYVVFFDDDDISHPQLLELSIKEIQYHEVDYCRYLRETFIKNAPEQFDQKLKYEVKLLGRKDLPAIITGEIPFNSCQVLWKKDCFNENYFNEDLLYAEEWECYSRILSTGLRGVNVKKVLFYGRKHPASNTGEFWMGNPERRASQIEAIKLVTENLKQKKLLDEKLIRYFVQMGIFLKEKSVIDYVLQTTNAGLFLRFKYIMLYKFYPVIVIGHRTKKLLKKKLS